MLLNMNLLVGVKPKELTQVSLHHLHPWFPNPSRFPSGREYLHVGVIHLQNYVNLTLPQEIHLIIEGTTRMVEDREATPRRHEGNEISLFHSIFSTRVPQIHPIFPRGESNFTWETPTFNTSETSPLWM